MFLVKRQDKFDASAEGVTVVEHDPKTEALRDLEAAEAEPADVCSNDEVKALMAFAELEGCSSLTTLSAYKESENARACLMDAAGHLLDSEDMVSTILQKLIPKEAGDPEKVHGFASLQEFMEDCVKPDGICKERREIVCAVDLLGRSYLTSGDADKEEILAKWHQLMRESYLGHQFSAWQKDVDVRRKWLESADTPDFLKSSVLEKINTDMLEEWERDVFDAHRDVLERQFNQGALEVLTRVDKSSEIISNRDMILSEFAEAWEGLSDTLSLGLRRYDELYTGTTQRKGKAAQLRPQLFDLYYSGLVETAINRATGNNSLNGSYGKNLAQNVNKLKSLDQSFDDLVFMRDAEVVTSTSVDPNSGNPQVLSERKAAAKEAVAAAQARRDKVFDNYENKKINQAQINATLSNTVDSLLTELVNLCGMPKGCVRATDPHCEPNVTGGYCGFDLPYDTKLPGNIDRALDMSGVNSAEMEKYYADKEYAFTDEELAKMGESDIFDYYSMTGTGEVAEA
ncbi:MAG: hypothetical protein II767_12415, partial [Proteobacteria bacterium]|nr:hypothetical protein [Pseudomonadota bacterium]